jgi:hypothetical protein
MLESDGALCNRLKGQGKERNLQLLWNDIHPDYSSRNPLVLKFIQFAGGVGVPESQPAPDQIGKNLPPPGQHQCLTRRGDRCIRLGNTKVLPQVWRA